MSVHILFSNKQLNDLFCQYQTLNNIGDEVEPEAANQEVLDEPKTVIEIEEEKLQLIIQINEHLSAIINQGLNKNNHEKEDDSNQNITKILNWMAFLFLVITGFLVDIIQSYLFGSTLFALIPNIASPVLLIVSMIYAFLDSILFLAFEIKFLKESIGVNLNNNEVGNLVKTLDSRLQEIKKIRAILTNTKYNSMDDRIYDDYVTLLNFLNKDLIKKHTELNEKTESYFYKFCKFAMMSFGGMASITYSYFISITILPIIGAALIGTPIGWAITALLILSGLGFYYAMEGRSVNQLINPEYQNFKTFKSSLDEYIKEINLNPVKTRKQALNQTQDDQNILYLQLRTI